MRYYIGTIDFSPTDELRHFGILGMKWGVRRYQNKDGTLTEAGKERYTKFQKVVDASRAVGEAYNKSKQIANERFSKLSDDNKADWQRETDIWNAQMKAYGYPNSNMSVEDYYHESTGINNPDEYSKAVSDYYKEAEEFGSSWLANIATPSDLSELVDNLYKFKNDTDSADYYKMAKKNIAEIAGFDYDKAKEYVDKEDKRAKERAKEKRNLDIVFDSEKGKKVYRQEAKKIWDKMSDNEKKYFIEEAKYFNDIGVSISPFNFFVDNSGTAYMDKIYENVVKRLGLD